MKEYLGRLISAIATRQSCCWLWTTSNTHRQAMASPRNDSESSPLLTPPRTESPHPERTTFSSLLSSNLFGGPGAWVAQAGLVLFVVTLWKVLYEHPAGQSFSSVSSSVHNGRSWLLFLSITYFPRRVDRSIHLSPGFQLVGYRWIHAGYVILFSIWIVFCDSVWWLCGSLDKLEIGVLLLQPTKTRIEKRKGFQLHQVFQYTALPLSESSLFSEITCCLMAKMRLKNSEADWWTFFCSKS